jgi:hypothetical protein
MSFSDETLAAYVDGEIDPAAGAEIEEAARQDPRIEQRIARYRALRNRLQAAYATELDEPVPDRLLAALQNPAPRPSTAVADLGTARAAKAQQSARGTAIAARWRYSLAASVLIAVGAGFLAWRHSHPASMENVDGTLIARGALATGLSDQLSGPAPQDTGASGSTVRIGLSFVAKSGDYCRTFSLSADAGLACHRAGRWEILALEKRVASEGTDSGFRTASSAMPTKVLEAVERQMASEPLDRAGEIAARGKGWNSVPR